MRTISSFDALDATVRVGRAGARAGATPKPYCSDVATLENIPLTVVPSEFTVVMITSAMPDAISAYSMAVAPDRSVASCRPQIEKRCFTCVSLDRRTVRAAVARVTAKR